LSTTEPVEDGLPVELPSGAIFRVLTESEVNYLDERRERYQQEFA
jgi:hypothetical protein